MDLASSAPQDVTWKARQVASGVGSRLRARRERSVPGTNAGVNPAGPSEEVAHSEGDVPAAAPRVRDPRELVEARRGIARSVISPLLAVGPSAASSVVQILGKRARTPVEAAHRELARHPWFPVTSGVDSFGMSINGAGGVSVDNGGSAERPSVTVRGEYDWLVLRDGVSQRRVEPPWSYGEFFEAFCAAEREYGLFDIATDDGVHVWELGRSALVIQLAEAAGLWGAASAVGGSVRDEYSGSKRLTAAPRARRVVFDYARRGQSGYRTAPFVRDDTLFVVQPSADGYPDVTESNMVYPFGEFSEWKKGWRRRWSHLRVPEVDARPFEEALSRSLGIRVDLGDHLRNRLAKFLAEREFFTPVFERVRPEEVLIASSHWWAGIGAAAARSGARVADECVCRACGGAARAARAAGVDGGAGRS